MEVPFDHLKEESALPPLSVSPHKLLHHIWEAFLALTDLDNLCGLLLFTTWLLLTQINVPNSTSTLQSLGHVVRFPGEISELLVCTFFSPFRQPWAPCFAVRRCAWCSSSFSQAQPITVSVNWESWAWSSSEMWVTLNSGSSCGSLVGSSLGHRAFLCVAILLRCVKI